MSKHLQIYIRLLLPVIFIAYLGGQSWFTHVHRVDQGVIVHAHPYQKKDHHSHTTKQLEVIQFFSHYLLPEVTVAEELLPVPEFHWCVTHYAQVEVQVVKTWLRQLAARGPPRRSLRD